jgi:hypothetical protein
LRSPLGDDRHYRRHVDHRLIAAERAIAWRAAVETVEDDTGMVGRYYTEAS